MIAAAHTVQKQDVANSPKVRYLDLSGILIY